MLRTGADVDDLPKLPMRHHFPAVLEAVGFPSLKRPAAKRFFQGSSLEFKSSLKKTSLGANLLVWGADYPARNSPEDGVVIRVEDGFLRSVGLGAGFVEPLSWVADTRGMYYDATRPSDLEHLLEAEEFSSSLIERAAKLRVRIVQMGITKYNVGTKPWSRPTSEGKIILVPGQVETDASIRLGSPIIKRNMDLLRAVRERRPDDYILYKPHPDVVAGLRLQKEDESPGEWCDEIVNDTPMGRLLEDVDEVHVMTSLAGFEALLRGRHVETYGQPFYAGWGLTTDHLPIHRRTRRLQLDELVAGVLILYPIYVSRKTRSYTTPEEVLTELVEWNNQPKRMPDRLRQWLGILRGLPILRNLLTT
jgi:capsular polysaccharide export protein